MADGPHHYHPACGHKGSSHLSPVHALHFFYRDASSALLQLVNQWLNFAYSRSHAFRYERKNTNPTLVRIELTTSVLADVQLTYETTRATSVSNCSTTDKGFTLRYAHDSLRTIYVPKLAMVYERDLGVTHVWNSTLRTGNPVRSGLVTQYMAFIREEQKKASVEASQAPAMLHSHLTATVAHMTPYHTGPL